MTRSKSSAKLAKRLVATTGLTVVTCLTTGVSAHADLKVPVTRCNTPAGSLAAHPSTAGLWQDTKVDDPSAFLVNLAVEGGCFTRAASPSSADFTILGGPLTEEEYESYKGRPANERIGSPVLSREGESLVNDTADLLRTFNPKMAYTYTEIRDSSDRPVVRGFGRNNRTGLDFSGWDTAGQVVPYMESGKSERRYGGAMFNGFDDVQVAIDAGRVRPGSGVASSGYGGSQTAYSGGSGASGGSYAGGGSAAQAPTNVAGLPGITQKEVFVGDNNLLAFKDRFSTPQYLTIRGYAGPPFETNVSVGRCSETRGQDPRCIGFNYREPAVMFSLLEASRMSVTDGRIKCTVVNGRATMKTYAVGDPIVIAGNFVISSMMGLPEIISEDCQIQGSWTPGSGVSNRQARGGATTTEPLSSLVRQADSNSFAFFQKYGGKRVGVTGPVSSIKPGTDGTIRVSMYDAALEKRVYCEVPASQGNKAAQLSKGRTATVIGKVVEENVLSSIPFDLEDCEIG